MRKSVVPTTLRQANDTSLKGGEWVSRFLGHDFSPNMIIWTSLGPQAIEERCCSGAHEVVGIYS